MGIWWRKVKLFSLLNLLPVLFCALLTAQTSSVTSDGYLRDWQNEGEHITFSTENGSVRSVMTVDDEKLVLRRYDERHRLIAETIWNSSYEEILSETAWTYSEKNVFPETMEKKLSEMKQIVRVAYNPAGYENNRSVYSTENGSETLIEKTDWQYDDKNRVIVQMHEKSGDAKNTDRSEYTYTEKSSEPDVLYYENDVLVEKTEYVAESSYYDSLFFDNMEIRILWTDGVKIEEVYYLDGKEFKRKSL